MFNNYAFTNATDNGLGLFLPQGLREAGLMSTTSSAYDCFTNQRFSYNLQAYMINYVISASSYYPLYA